MSNVMPEGPGPFRDWLEHPIRLTPGEARELKRRADAGDDQAREQLVHFALPYAIKLANAFHQRTGFDLDECLSVAGLGAVECAAKFDPDRGALLTFVNCRMRSLLPEAKRKAERGPQTTQGDFDFDRVAGESTARETRAEQVRTALQQLSPRLQYIVEQRYFEGRSNADVGRKLGLTRERVRQLALRGKRMLKQLLADHVEGV